jgi:(2Fe-2S) ferredoxin
VYPDGVFYGNVQLNDVQEIVDEHIVKGRPVERLQLKFKRA